ncbi:putative 6-deoxy-D-mannoheptose pathway protein [Vibrio coralliirubri]|uniref:NAD-dependent epimerase/dehydratase family protein n=2 Tax=Vibrio coralliirubri TaxID=1516159 RepID=UPI0006315EB4|nr:sugar nucleotide-binding protein [Vibrio coralliirubri]CDT93180.1 putative 6-deoxy-D-mannoheptose pathway protein [Vibrio coralliirubri]
MVFEKKVFIFGASGFVGRSLYDYLDINDKYSVGRVNCDIHADLSLSDFDELYSAVKKGDMVVFLAAVSAPDECEKNYELSYEINVTNTVRLIRLLISKGVRVLFSSSDAVFGATNSLCFESSRKHPFGRYGEMKSEVEDCFKDDSNFFSIRFSYVISENDKFSKMVKSAANSKENIDVFDGFERNVIALDDVLLGIKNIITDWDHIDTRIVNFSGEKLVSRQDLVKELTIQKYPNLVYSFTAAPDNFWSSRSKIINTESKYLEAILGRPMKSYKECIKEYS